MAPQNLNEETFVRLFVRAQRIAARIAGAAQAEELAAETMFRAWKSWNRVSKHPDAWVARVVSNLAIDRLKKRPLSISGQPEPNLDDAVTTRLTVVEALKTLPRRQQQVAVLHHLVGMTDAEVARALGIAVPTAKNHLVRANRTLRLTIQEGQVHAN
jgi:RNA polymerase sigma factor (sigma-70 family)